MAVTYAEFEQTLDGDSRDLVNEINDILTKNGACKCEIKEAKLGYVVSYRKVSDKKVLANIVFRRSAIKIRIYADHVAEYQDFLDTLPKNIKKEIAKASSCKRLLDPNDCNPKCSMGYTFMLDGELCKKCRYGAFMPSLSTENNPAIIEFLEKELAR